MEAAFQPVVLEILPTIHKCCTYEHRKILRVWTLTLLRTEQKAVNIRRSLKTALNNLREAWRTIPDYSLNVCTCFNKALHLLSVFPTKQNKMTSRPRLLHSTVFDSILNLLNNFQIVSEIMILCFDMSMCPERIE